MKLDNFSFKKKFGQNFIKDDAIVEKIKKVADVSDNSLIIEVGPGAGALTSKLINTNNTVIAYEIDESLEDYLLEKFKNNNNFHLIMGDFLDRNVSLDVSKYKYDKLYVVANLPYYITTPIIEKVIKELDADKIVIMVQKEVGDRFAAKPCTKDYGSLTVFLNYYFDIKKEFVVSRNSFVPSPNVDSIVVSLTKKDNKFDVKDIDKFQKLVRESFQFKRKNIKNNLKNYDLEKVSDILKKYDYDLTVRAESLPLEVFVELSNSL